MLLTNITYNESADQYTLFFSRPNGLNHHIMVRNIHGLSDLFHGEINYKADVQAYADLEAAHKHNLDLLIRLSSDDDINDDTDIDPAYKAESIVIEDEEQSAHDRYMDSQENYLGDVQLGD